MTENDSKHLANQAWDHFRNGNFSGAEQAAMSAIKQSARIKATPWVDILILKAFHLLRLQNYDESRILFGRALELAPDDACAQEGFLLALRDRLKGTKQIPPDTLDTESAEQPGTHVLLMGLGMGRSGSTSLTKLWETQDNCYCFHEHPPRLTWTENPSRWEFHKRRFDILLDRYRFVGDVSHWWLPYVDRIMESYENARLVVLKRQREAVIKSVLKMKTLRDGRMMNHWIDHDGSLWVKHDWDECYPSYNVSNIREALERYWDEYYATVDILIDRFPSSIRVFPTEELSEADTQLKILSFCGFESPRIVDGLHLNKGTVVDGRSGYLR